MKRTVTFLGLSLYAALSSAQLVEEDFSTGIPGNWTQWSGTGITWTSNSNFGNTATGCAIADFSTSSEDANGWLQTPTMDLTTTNSPEISFSVALIGNNFVAPDVSLWYDVGVGWVLIDTWGSSIVANNQIDQTMNLSPTLDANNITWVDINYDLSNYTSENNIRFSFGADFINGGWVLVDDVLIEDSNPGPNDIQEQQTNSELSIFPNPSSGIVHLSVDENVEYVEIYNCIGQLERKITMSSGNTDYSQDLSSFNSGVYFVSSFKNGTCLNTKKIILE